MTPTKPQTLLLIALVTTVLGFALARVWEAAGARPLPVPWTAVLGMLVIAVAVLVVTWPVRRWNAGHRDRRLDPLRAARSVVLAKAASMCGALLGGWYLGQALVVLGDLGIEPRRERFAAAVLSVLAAVAVLVAGLVAERWCRLPPDSDDGDGRDDRDAVAG